MATGLEYIIGNNTISVRDLIDRFEELEDSEYEGDTLERTEILAILEDLREEGGDEQWRGAWYPAVLIADEYFIEHCQDLLYDCGTIPSDLPSWIEIDWQATARNMRADYSSIDLDGGYYWYR
jgi:hypothetical protein